MTYQAPHLARGYIASGEFNGNRAPQHIQNQIVKLYCDSRSLKFVLSRAEYWINGSTSCQLWAALKEGFQHIVFFSIWQLPIGTDERQTIYNYCMQNHITLHFASERISTDSSPEACDELELLLKVYYTSREGIKQAKHIESLKLFV